MLRFTLRQLEYFVVVGDLGSITLAAEKVNVSAPSVSSAISQLETQLGLPLFVRHHAQGLSLNTAGRQVHGQAKIVLKEADNIVDLAANIGGQVRGTLTVGCLVSFAQVVLPSLRKSFVDSYKEVRFSQMELDQNAIFSALRRAEIDVALTYDLKLPPDLTFVPLLELPPFLIVSQSHKYAKRDTVDIEELADLPMILLDLPHSSDYFMSFFNKTDGKPNIVERTRDMAVMRSLVANGFGYSFANTRPVNNSSPDGKPLKFIPLGGDIPSLSMGFLMTKDAESANVVRSFVEFTRNWIRKGYAPGIVPRVV